MRKFANIVKIAIIFLVIFNLYGCKYSSNGTAQGYIEGRYTYMSSQMAGTLMKLGVERGTKVTKGQEIAQLEYNPQQAEYQQAQFELQKAQDELSNAEKAKRPTEIAAIVEKQKQLIPQIVYAEKTVGRYTKLAKTNFLAKEKLDEAISTYNKLNAMLAEATENLKTAKLPVSRVDEVNAAKAAVQAAKANVSKALWQLVQKRVAAPVSGIVYDTYYRLGEVVPADHPILSILAPENVYVIFYLPEVNLSQIKIGQKIKVTCDGRTKPISATVYYIGDKAEFTPPVIYSEKTRSKLVYRIEAKLSIADAKILHPGQPITVLF